MRSLHLIFAVTALVVTCEPQRSNNDIIWYPVEEEEGVFISTLGEKYRSSPQPKWRSHRRARYSGMEAPLPLSYDPTENQDPSFFHDITERKPLLYDTTIPKIPPSFQNQQFALDRLNERPQGQKKENFNENSFQEILNEVFDYNKYPLGGEFPGGRPGTTSQWSNRPSTQNQWVGNPMTENTFQWVSETQRPGMENQWETSGVLVNTEQRPSIFNQGSGTSSRPFTRPTQGNSESYRPISSSRPNRPSSSSRPNKPSSSSRPNKPSSSSRPNKPSSSSIPNRPTSQSDKLVFPEEASSPTTTPSDLNPTDPPTMSPCEKLCPVTPEFNPVCGSDSVTYTNAGRLKCAQKCGKNVELAHYGNCGRTSLVTPLVSGSRRQKSRGFWFIDK